MIFQISDYFQHLNFLEYLFVRLVRSNGNSARAKASACRRGHSRRRRASRGPATGALLLCVRLRTERRRYRYYYVTGEPATETTDGGNGQHMIEMRLLETIEREKGVGEVHWLTTNTMRWSARFGERRRRRNRRRRPATVER